MKKLILLHLSVIAILVVCTSNKGSQNIAMLPKYSDSLESKKNFDSGKVNFFAMYKTSNPDSQIYYEKKALHFFYKLVDTTTKQVLNENSRTVIVWLSDMYWNKEFHLSYNLYDFVGKTHYDDARVIELLSSRFQPSFRSKEFITKYEKTLKAILHQKDPNYMKYAVLREELESVFSNDQRFRQALLSAEKRNDKKKIAEFKDSIVFYDKKNYVIVRTILDRQGLPGSDKVGAKAVKAIFLVIQHSSRRDFEGFKPLIETAYKDKIISPEDYALYIDRYYVYTTGRQLYGTQSYYNSLKKKDILYPFTDASKVDSLRKSIGLKSLHQ